MALADSAREAEPLVPGVSPQVFSSRDFARVAQLVQSEAGIVLSEKKQMLVYSRIAPLVRTSGMQTFSDYLDWIAKDKSGKTQAISALTTNHTYFYREPHHYEHFAQHVRPHLVKRALAGDAVRLWSAGCSSGEEVWTLMMVLLGENRAEGLQISKSDVLALASDLAGHVINTASQGIYLADALDAVPSELRTAWSNPVPAETPAKATISDDVRRLVRFRQLNLLRPWPFRQCFDVIFCRNVMIYFDLGSKEQLLAALAKQLNPDGYLYIGHSERVSGEAAALLEPVGPTVYRRRAE